MDISGVNNNSIDFNKLLTVPSRNTLSQGINDALINKFFSRYDMETVYGLIGNFTEGKSILENTEYDKQNQLQPVISLDFGSETELYDFKDIENLAIRSGVDFSGFDDWGNSQQFNFVPPIDLDKFINFRNYYWTDVNTSPDYVTIKNVCNIKNSRLLRETRRLSSGIRSFSGVSTGNIITIPRNVISNIFTNSYIIVSGDNDIKLAVVQSVSVNGNITTVEVEWDSGSVNGDITITPTSFNIISLNVLTNSIIVSGNLVNVLGPDSFVRLSTLNDTEIPMNYRIISAVLTPDGFNTEIRLNPPIVSPRFSRIDISLLLRLILEESRDGCDSSPSSLPIRPPTAFDLLPKLLWNRDFKLLPMVQDTLQVETVGGLTTITLDPSINLSSIRALNQTSDGGGDFVKIFNGPNRGFYPITSVNNNTKVITIEIDSLFEYNSNQIQIVRRIPYLRAIRPPAQPVTGDYWIDTQSPTGDLRRFDGTEWEIVEGNISILLDYIGERPISNFKQSDDWSSKNRWIHRDDLLSTGGLDAAKAPIIEFDPAIEMVKYSISEKEWMYRSSEQSPYAIVTEQPTLFESTLINWEKFTFLADKRSIVFHHSVGDLTKDISPGDFIRLVDFAVNNGVYEVENVTYSRINSSEYFRSMIVLKTDLPNENDLTPFGNRNPHIGPRFTTFGDRWTGFNSAQWKLAGVKTIKPTSKTPQPSRMLNDFLIYDGGPDVTAQNRESAFSFKYGLFYVEYNLKDQTLVEGSTGATLLLPPSLQELCLYDDYQEGDIRVFIDGKRVYNNFIDLESPIDSRFVGGIKFDDSITLTSDNVVRIELGEIADSDIGRRARIVNTKNGTDIFNLTNFRIVEQIKSESSVYPLFTVYNAKKEPLDLASPLFKYKENTAMPVDTVLNSRVDKTISGQYIFENLGVIDNKLVIFKDMWDDIISFKTIWTPGSNLEQFAQVKIGDEWNLPPQMFFNLKHETRSDISLDQIFPHFKSILDSQDPRILERINSSLPGDINLGVGGFIKEHNDGFDFFVSILLSCGYTVPEIVKFARTQYDSLYFNVISSIVNEISAFANEDDFVEYFISKIELNDNLNKIFGDSTTFDSESDIGVRNWVVSPAYLGLTRKTVPYKFKDGANWIIRKHDGSYFYLNSTSVPPQSLLYGIPVVTSLPTDSESVIVSLNGNIFVYDSAENTWDELNVLDRISEILLEVETRLFNNCPDYTVGGQFVPKYDIFKNAATPSYMRTLLNDLDISNIFSETDTFSWNYIGATITNPYSAAQPAIISVSGFNKIYQEVFGTTFPHREPWILQGYADKPSWWDYTYLSINSSRYWEELMWDNIINGVIPVGFELPNGNISTGVVGEAPLYLNLPVNTTGDDFLGVSPDGLLPPYWDTTVNSSATLVPLISNIDNIPNRSTTAELGSFGVTETISSLTSDFIARRIIASYATDPLVLVRSIFGNTHDIINCLQIDERTGRVSSHSDVIFHGQLIDNITYRVNGLNQLFVQKARYDGRDNFASEVYNKFANWLVKLGYNTNSLVDKESLSLIDRNKLTEEDYRLILKSSKFGQSKDFSGLIVEMLEVPSRFARNREFGIGWKAKFFRNLKSTIRVMGVQNYKLNHVSENLYEIDSYPIAQITESGIFNFYDIHINGDHRYRFSVGDSVVVSGTEYTIQLVFGSENTTSIRVLAPTGIDAGAFVLYPKNRRTLPEWGPSTALIVRSDLPLETDFDLDSPVFANVIDEYRVRLFDGPVGSVNSFPIEFAISSSEFLTIGNPQATFSTNDFDGWVNFELDETYIMEFNSEIICNTIQNMIDYIRGYYAYLRSTGISEISSNGENTTDGRPNDWQLEVEKFINWAFLVRKFKNEQLPSFKATVSVSGTLVLEEYNNSFNTGELLTVSRTVLSQRREEAFFAVKLSNGELSLALDRYSASIGRVISLAGFGSDIIVTKTTPQRLLPTFELNPYRDFLHITLDYGILDSSSVNECKNLKYGIFDNRKERLSLDKLIFIRNDPYSQIRLTEDTISSNKNILNFTSSSGLSFNNNTSHISYGMLDVIDFKNYIIFENNSVDGSIKYDPFLGIRVNDILISMLKKRRPDGKPFAPGYVLDENDNIRPNLENQVSAIRNYYDRYKNVRPKTFENLLNTIGYNGDFDYLDDLGFTDITKFEFWRGFLQNKGTNLSLTAFTNNAIFENVAVDEFWAYKQAEFGDSKPRVYPEMVVKYDEAQRNDIRYEFVAPDEASLDSSFTEVRLTDFARWVDQPDQLAKMLPNQSFFFDAEPVELIEFNNTEKLIINSRGTFLVFDTPAEGVIITELVDGERLSLIENRDFTRINSRLIKLNIQIEQSRNLVAVSFTYSKEKNNPAKLVDRSKDSVIRNIQLWDPYRGIHYDKVSSVIDYNSNTDPAVYNTNRATGTPSSVNTESFYWSADKEGTYWLDTSNTYYVPYYDIRVSGSLEYSLFNWGELGQNADLGLYKWVKSPVPPLSLEKYNDSMPVADKITGTPRLSIYENIGSTDDPLWVKQPDIEINEYIVGLIDSSTNVPMVGVVEIYRNGVYLRDLDLNQVTLWDFIIDPFSGFVFNDSDYIILKGKRYVPTDEDLQQSRYKYDAEYVETEVVNQSTGQTMKEYYFWIRDSDDSTTINGVPSMTQKQAEAYLKNIPEPYMIITGFRPFDSYGYGVVYGVTYDPDNFNLPNRFTRVIIRGIDGLVSDDNRFSIKWTRDLTLRDSLEDNLSRKNKHTEWKLFREFQPNRIDRYLWDRIEEASVGFRVVNGNINLLTAVPSRDRIVYDTLYGTNTRYGLDSMSVLCDWEDVLEALVILGNTDQDVRQLIETSNLTLPDRRIEILEFIYNNKSAQVINSLFFNILYNYMAKKNDVNNMMKTSWVAIDIGGNANIRTQVPRVSPLLEDGDRCIRRPRDRITESLIIDPIIPPPVGCFILTEDGLIFNLEELSGEFISLEQC